MKKPVLMLKHMISTREWHAEHPFAGQNTQHIYIIFNGKLQLYALFYTIPISFLHLHLTYYIYVRHKDFYSCKEHLQQ